MKDVRAVAEVCANTGTIGENYAPDSIAPGRHVNREPVVRDLVGWSGISPILYFLEFAIGLKSDVASNTLHWDIHSYQRSGCERFRFNGRLVSLIATPRHGGKTAHLFIKTDGPFTLIVSREGVSGTRSIPAGTTEQEFPSRGGKTGSTQGS